MLAVRIQGGLGNQIFQYLLALELKEQFPEADVAIDLNSYNRFRPHNGYELEKWVERDPRIRELTGREHFRVTGKLPYLGSRRLLARVTPLAKITRKLIGGMNRCIDLINRSLPEKGNTVCQEYTDGYPAIRMDALDPGTDHYFDGTWFSQQLSETVLQQRFRFKPAEDPEFPGLKDRMAQEASVSIHIRHGDYPAWGYEVLSDRYYHEAIGYMKEQLTDPSFYIFSDDPEYARTVIAPMCGSKVTLIERKDPSGACLDLQLMAACRDHIIANSTFSLAAWEFSRKEGLLVAPRTWIHGNTTWDIPKCHYLDA